MSSEFVKLSNNLAYSKDIPENLIDCIENLNIKWKKNHIHKYITEYTTGIQHDIDYAVLKINEKVKNNIDNALILIEHIPYNEDKEFVDKRNIIY